jgi:hypothetical protein
MLLTTLLYQLQQHYIYCYSLDLDLFCQLPGNTCRPHRSSNKLRSIQLLLNSPATRQPTGYILVNITGGCTAYTTHSMITEEQTTKVNPVSLVTAAVQRVHPTCCDRHTVRIHDTRINVLCIQESEFTRV